MFKRKSKKPNVANELSRLKADKAELIDRIKGTGSAEKIDALKAKLERDINRRLAPLPDFRKPTR